MRAHIQAKAGKPYNVSVTLAAHGFAQRGCELLPFAKEALDDIDFRPEDVVVGGVGTYQRIFQRMGKGWDSVSYPESLNGFLGRKIESIYLKDLALRLENGPVFVKPARDDKSFTGFVCRDRWIPVLAGLEAETALVISGIIDFQSEYRVYVLEGKIQNMCRYRGNGAILPNVRMVREMIESFTPAPIAYGLDVGVTGRGETLLVEVNEALALGNYGLAPALHAKMIAARWYEIMGNRIRAEEEAQTVEFPPYLNET